ncbi:MAG: precorrin-6A synthase (deacetylating), partial [Rhodobacteraceae bacterium]|nr:precorrin-6A synthase (deacetylating) [Paracoccaceae bacterium]
MQELLLIGIGTGNPDHITGEARRAMRCADAILIPQKGPGKEDLADLRLQICDAILGADTARIVTFDLPVRDERVGYVAGVAAWH